MNRHRFLQPFYNWKLRRKLIVLFVVLVMLPILTFTSYNIWHTYQSMTQDVETSFSNSIYQVSTRISHQFDRYNAALYFLVLNRQISDIFEDEESSYYQQYDVMRYVLEPTLMEVEQLAPKLESVGVYTDNHHLNERNESVLYMEKISERDWFPELSLQRRIRWVRDEGELLGLARMMKSSSRAPDTIAYIRLNPDDVFDVALENYPAYGVLVESGAEIIYSANYGMEALDPALLQGSAQTGGDHRYKDYMVVRHKIDALDWTLCVYCPYEALNINLQDAIGSLVFLAIGSLLLLTIMGTFIANSISSRLSRLNDSISKVAAGYLNQEYDTFGGDEIGELSQHFSRMVASLDQHIHINYENKLLLQEAELKALQAQINPHFLYNSLSLINWMAIDCDSAEISEITCALSDFYRSVLNNGNSEMTVRDEVKNIEAYLKIQSYMHDGSFEVIIDIDEEIMDCEIMGIIFQPLVENAIEHGIDCRREATGARISIVGRGEENTLRFYVEDNGPGMAMEQFIESINHSSKTYGLKNVQDRLKIAYGDEYGLSLAADAGTLTRIYISIPRKHMKNHA